MNKHYNAKIEKDGNIVKTITSENKLYTQQMALEWVIANYISRKGIKIEFSTSTEITNFTIKFEDYDF